MAPPNPEFELELDLSKITSTKDWVAYRRLIDDVRSRLGVRFSHNRPVLPAEQATPTRWFDIVLRTRENYAVRFRMRMDNLYLVGYRLENERNWFEFTDDDGNPQHLIDGSTSLGFGGSYIALMHRNAGNWNWEDIRVSRNDHLVAVENLNTTDRRQRARSLITTILMINEAIRLNDLKQFFSAHHSETLQAPAAFDYLVHGWGNLSGRLLHADADPTHYFRIPPNAMGIQTAQQAVDALGILKDCSILPGKLGKFSRSAFPNEVTAQGQPLVEVFSVRINDAANESNIYGMITVTDGLTCQYIYNRKRDDHEKSIYEGNAILLAGPARSISAYDSFTIDVDLKDKNKPSAYEVSRGQISWNVFLTTNQYNKPLSKNVGGKNGSATVNYVVLRNAVEAAVEVTLISGDGKNPAEVYGLITARSEKIVNESMLFWKTSNDKDIEVKPGQPIRLLRSTAAVPLSSSLVVKAELFNRDRKAITNHQIASGSASFPASLSGVSTKKISGKYGEIQVKITWKDM